MLLLLMVPPMVASLPVYPSCMVGDTTWDSSLVSGTFSDVQSPEFCQRLCEDDPTCLGFTWVPSSSLVFPLTCATFDTITGGMEVPCAGCVSGPPFCPCSKAGECEAEPGIIIDILSDVASEGVCAEHCQAPGPCSHYTYFGPNNPLRSVCLLYSSCPVYSTSCTDCWSGVPACDICSFQDTSNGDCGGDSTTTTTQAPTTTTQGTPAPTTATPFPTTISETPAPSTTTAAPTTTTTAAPTTTTLSPTTTTEKDYEGLLVVGGRGAAREVEFWAPQPHESCILPALPRDMTGATVDYGWGGVLACQGPGCLRLAGDGWVAGPQTIHPRQGHSSVVTPRGLLLVGGSSSPTTTELLVEGEHSVDSFSLIPGRENHCSIQLQQNGYTTMVLTGGYKTEELVTMFSGLEGDTVTFSDLAELNTGRGFHACGSYSLGGIEMLIVAGGFSGTEYLSSTEVMAMEPQGVWMETSPLPAPRYSPRGASLGGQVLVSGGLSTSSTLASLVAWHPLEEEWREVGTLAHARRDHAATSIPHSAVAHLC